MNNYLSHEDIERGLTLTGVNPLRFYQQRKGRLAFKKQDIICEVCGLGEWVEGTSYYMMWERAFGKEGAEFISNLPALINTDLQYSR